VALHSWESPLDGQRVLLSESALRGLRTLAIDGFTSLPRRGLEVGGLLFGNGHSAEIVIEGFEEAPCEHRYGPSYALSADDRAKLSEVLEQRRNGTSPVVGFFRSFTGRDPLLEEADEAFVQKHFPQGNFLYLLLQPLSADNCVAGFRFFRDGQPLPDTEDPPFAFDHRQIPVMESAIEESAIEKEPVIEKEIVLEEPEQQLLPRAYRNRQEAPAPIAEPVRPRARWWIPALIFLNAAIAGAVIYELATPPPKPQWVELRLDARPVGGKLVMVWDVTAPRVLHATRGQLILNDGGRQRKIDLDPAQIRSGKFTVAPSPLDVGVRLILYAQGLAVAGDSVRVASIPSPIVAAMTAPPSAAPVASRAPAPPAPAPETQPSVVKPPETLHEVQPTIPAGIRSRISEPVVIPVRVEVNERGRVVSAAPEAQIDGVRSYLADLAQKASREWRFRPARTSTGIAVASNKTIQFVFNP
jgi:hypothetical protein